MSIGSDDGFARRAIAGFGVLALWGVLTVACVPRREAPAEPALGGAVLAEREDDRAIPETKGGAEETGGPAAPAAANPWSEAAREALIAPCGSCHRPGLPTSVKGALEVFDLEERMWYVRMSDEQLDALLRRVRGSESIDPFDKQALERFVACEREGACQPL